MHISFHNIYNSHFRNREGCTFRSGPPHLLPLLTLVSYLELSFIRFSEMNYLAKLNEKKSVYLECSTQLLSFILFLQKNISYSLTNFRISDICISLGRCYLFNDSAKFNDLVMTKFILDTAKKC